MPEEVLMVLLCVCVYVWVGVFDLFIAYVSMGV